MADAISGAHCFVSVPFSMGTVLHRRVRVDRRRNSQCFSPLLDGDGVASRHRWLCCGVDSLVSVPFSMGTVLHQRSPRCWGIDTQCFSPLLDGDGVASFRRSLGGCRLHLFQSPSRWGRCCIVTKEHGTRCESRVSVPFSMGTVLHPAESHTILSPRTPEFQSPSRWGRCCIWKATPLPEGHPGVSVPFSMGTVLHRNWRFWLLSGELCFSPLLDGDGVASEETIVWHGAYFGFSPLLDGDGVASGQPQGRSTKS